MFTEEFTEEWIEITKHLAYPRRSGLKRTAGTQLGEHTDALILRKFKSEININDYFSENPPQAPPTTISQKLQAKASINVPFYSQNTKSSKIISHIERSTTEELEHVGGTSVCICETIKYYY